MAEIPARRYRSCRMAFTACNHHGAASDDSLAHPMAAYTPGMVRTFGCPMDSVPCQKTLTRKDDL